MQLWCRKDKPLGCQDFMRAELSYKYKGQQFWVTSNDGYKIDCYIIKA